MPTVARIGPYRVFFYASDGGEPAHIHVARDAHVAKVWLQPVSLASSGYFPARELGDIIELVRRNQAAFLEAWNAFFTHKPGPRTRH